MKTSDLLLEKYLRIEFGNHVFYVPRISANIYFKNNSLAIDMANMSEYAVVDGMRCYYCLMYNADNDILQTWLKDWELDGAVFSLPHEFTFPINAKNFPFSQRDTRMVVPKRDYSEIVLAFLEQHDELDNRISEFLKNHPDMFEQAAIKDWLLLNKYLEINVFDEDSIEDCLPKSVANLFAVECSTPHKLPCGVKTTATWSMSHFFHRCDNLIKDWQKNCFNTTKTFKSDPFLNVKKTGGKAGLLKPGYIDLMPEPFFGDPENNLGVLLNLNPGCGKNDRKFIGKKVVKGRLHKGYSAFAKTNPYLTDPSFHPDAHVWWKKRLHWLEDLLDYKENDRLPFIMGFCPIQSHRLTEAGITRLNSNQQTYIQHNVLNPAAYAAKHSELGFIISTGEVFTKIFPTLGFNLIKEWEPNTGISGWPKHPKTGKDQQVHFKYYKKMR